MTAPVVIPTSRRYWTDVVERVGLTYLESFVALLVVDAANWTVVGDVLSSGRSALIAAAPAALSLVKSLLAKLVGNGDSASLAKTV